MHAASGFVPGKLMLAGEYAVLGPGGRALAVAVGELVHWQTAPGPPSLVLQAYDRVFRWQPGRPAPAGIAAYAVAAATAFAAIGLPLSSPVQLRAAGRLGGRKLGLGTSAGVVVATGEAIAAAHGRAFDLALLRACDDAHRAAQGGRGSGYDVFAMGQGHVSRYDRQARSVQALAWPHGLSAIALYAGQGANTRDAIGGRVQADDVTAGAIAAAERGLAAALAMADISAVLAAVDAAEAAFARLASTSTWLTSAGLQRVAAHVAAFGGHYRTSGAGGGDCGLGFFVSRHDADDAARAWHANGGLVVATLPDDLRDGGLVAAAEDATHAQ